MIRTLAVLLVAALSSGCEQAPRVSESAMPQVEATLVAVLGEANEERDGGVGPFFTLARSPRGEWLLSYLARRGEIMVFGPTGEFIRTVGRRGRGPGEFLFIQHLRASDSLVHVLDAGQRRWARLSPDLSWLDSSPLQAEGSSFVVLGDTLAALNIRSVAYGAVGEPVRVFGWGGAQAGGFGDTLDMTDPLVNATSGRVLAVGRDGASVWVGHAARYRLEHWSGDRAPLGVVEREVPWFPPGTGTYLPTPEQAPPALMAGVAEDADGRIWVAIHVPDEDWAAAVVRSPVPEGSGYEVEDWNRFVDTLVEVIDPATGRLLATGRFDAALHLLSSEHAAVYLQDERGVPKIEILGLGLSR